MSELSFSKKARLEALDNFKFSKNDIFNTAFLKGFFFSDFHSENSEIIFQADLEKTVKSIKKLLSKYEIESDIQEYVKLDNKLAYKLIVNDKNTLLSTLTLHQLNLTDKRVFQCYITGLFVAEARLTDPSKDYQVDFVFKEERTAKAAQNLLSENGFMFKISKRKNHFVVYTKQSEIIEDLLATVGAQNSCLEIMSGKVLKDIRNRMNRITNCDTANIAKSTAAGHKHIQAIDKLMETGMFDSLEQELKDIALLKIENPELSLTELGNICTPPLTKSSVNRRMQKLCTLANIKEK